MSNTPYMPFWIGDFVADTMDLDAKEVGAYMLILMALWGKRGSIPADPKKLQRVARIGRDWPKVWAALSPYFTVENGRLTNRKLSQVLREVDAKRAVNAHAGARGGRAKALKDKERALANANVSLQQSKPKPELKKEKEEKEGRASALDCLAEVVGHDLASDFIAHRKAIRKPMTPQAGRLMAAKLGQWPPPEREAALQRSIENGWTGVFETPPNVTPFPSNRRQTDGERTDELFAKLGAELARQQFGE